MFVSWATVCRLGAGLAYKSVSDLPRPSSRHYCSSLKQTVRKNLLIMLFKIPTVAALTVLGGLAVANAAQNLARDFTAKVCVNGALCRTCRVIHNPLFRFFALALP